MENMTDSTEYRLYADTALVQLGNVKLNQGDSILFEIPGTGSMFRLEVDQALNHPTNTMVAAALEGCVPVLTSTSSRGMINKYTNPIREPEPEFAIDCKEIIGSFDPNDKQVIPQGLDSVGLTPPGSRLQYLIRFQNTGNDTAFTVIIVDTLSSELDMSTFQVGNSSHPFIMKVEGGRWSIPNR